MKKLTFILYRFIYIFSACLTVGAFTFANLTALSPTKYGGGNGNIGLLPFAFLFPFIIIFIAMSISYLHEYLYRKLEMNTIRVVVGVSLLGVILILSLTFIKAFQLKSLLAEVNPIYREETKIPLLTMNSNAVFFNFFTFILLLLVCSFISGMMAFKDKQRK
ncbi:hypothetical protein JFL43_16095 [Viridibacillus sp. YIM B01967]|uniref:Uncharacterized protein n=1 Tax=Viridibacillus soli TaxID=2798301 RepID=A0ABS1HBJ3_9BACL|nr:hypothetical protein [Viridibacillus soli]MBK3496353.1 hypothetical protein [Viridibacillus soli]